MNNKWKFIPSFLSDVGAATPNEANEKETFFYYLYFRED